MHIFTDEDEGKLGTRILGKQSRAGAPGSDFRLSSPWTGE